MCVTKDECSRVQTEYWLIDCIWNLGYTTSVWCYPCPWGWLVAFDGGATPWSGPGCLLYQKCSWNFHPSLGIRFHQIDVAMIVVGDGVVVVNGTIFRAVCCCIMVAFGLKSIACPHGVCTPR